MLSNLLTLVALLIGSVWSATAFADTRQKNIPDTIDLQMGANTLAFAHKKHIKSVNSVCIYCHATEKGIIDGGFGTDTARILCIPCHDKEPSFTADCKGCHPSVKAITLK